MNEAEEQFSSSKFFF